MPDHATAAILRIADTSHTQLVKNWSFCEEIGGYQILVTQLDHCEPYVLDQNDLTLTVAYDHFREVARVGLEFELEHGEGCLRKLDHPWWIKTLRGKRTRKEWLKSGAGGWHFQSKELVDEGGLQRMLPGEIVSSSAMTVAISNS